MNIINLILNSKEFQQAMATTQNNANHFTTIGQHSLLVAEQLKDDDTLYIVALLHDLGKLTTKQEINGVDRFFNHANESVKIATSILQNTNLSQDNINEILFLIKEHDTTITTQKALNRRLNKVSMDTMRRLARLRLADINAQTDYNRDIKLNNLKIFTTLLDIQ